MHMAGFCEHNNKPLSTMTNSTIFICKKDVLYEITQLMYFV